MVAKLVRERKANKEAYAFFLKNIKKLKLTNNERLIFTKGAVLWNNYSKQFNKKEK